MHSQTRAYINAGAAVLLWSTVASAFKLSLRYLEPLQLVFFAGSFSAFSLFFILILCGKVHLLLIYPKKQMPACLLLGLINPCLYYFLLFEAYNRLPAQDALSINYSWPLMLVILSLFFLRQRIRALELVAIVIAYFGVIIIATHGKLSSLDFSDRAGVALAVASTLIWATYWIMLVRQKEDLTITLFLSFLFALPVLFIITSIFCPVSNVGIKGVIGAAYVGLFEMGITFVLWSTALRLSSTTAKVSSLAYISPFLSLLIIRAVLGEEIKAATLLGLVLIMAGIVSQAVFNKNVRSGVA